MRHTSTHGHALYDPVAQVGEAETRIATAMLICGLDLANYDACTIDELVAAANATFPPSTTRITTRLFGKTGIEDKNLIGAVDWLIKLNGALHIRLRIDWRNRHMGKWVIASGG